MVSILQALGSFKKWYKCEGVSVGGQQVRTRMKLEGCGHSEVMLPDRAKAIWLARAMDWIGNEIFIEAIRGGLKKIWVYLSLTRNWSKVGPGSQEKPQLCTYLSTPSYLQDLVMTSNPNDEHKLPVKYPIPHRIGCDILWVLVSPLLYRLFCAPHRPSGFERKQRLFWCHDSLGTTWDYS